MQMKMQIIFKLGHKLGLYHLIDLIVFHNKYKPFSLECIIILFSAFTTYIKYLHKCITQKKQYHVA